MVSSLSIARFITFVGVSVFGTIAMGLCAYFIYGAGNVPFAGLTVATGALTLLTLPAMMLIDNIRQGAVTSYIAVEAGWLGLLGVLFLSSGAVTSNASQGLPATCSSISKFLINRDAWIALCNEVKAVQAFTFLAWILCWGYAITLCIAAINLANRGYSGVWTQSVQHTDFSAPPQNTGVPPVAGFVPQMQPQMMQPAQGVYPAAAPQLVAQPGSYAGSPAFGQPIPVGTPQPGQQV